MGGDDGVDPRPERDAHLLTRLIDAMADPFRVRLLSAVNERPGITVREITGWVGGTDRKVRYHMEALVAAGLVEIQDEVRRRGAIERRYRSATPMVVGVPPEQRPPEIQERRIALEVLKLMMADATASVASGHFGTRDGHCETRIRGEVDEESWNELAAIFLRAAEEAIEVVRQGVERQADSSEGGIEVTAGLLLFEAPIWNRQA